MPRHLALAITFLTGLPLRVSGDVTPADLWRSMGWYPLVGLALGAGAWGLYAGLSWLLPSLVAAALVVLLLEVFTRGLHLDGLMDTCSGYLSGAERERALEIMKDSRAGAMGVAGAVLVIVLKVAALGALTSAAAAAPLLAGWAAARALPPVDVWVFAYARPSGTGEPFTRTRSPGPLALAFAMLTAALVVSMAIVGWIGRDAAGTPPWYAAPLVAIVALAVPMAVQAAVAKRLGGLTGDVYGMGIELAETTALVFASGFVS